MIIPDVNILIYAHDETSRFHEKARAWWETQMINQIPIGLPLVSVLGFVRILSNPRAVKTPGNPAVLMTIMEHILYQPNVSLLSPGTGHLGIMAKLFGDARCTGKMTTDVHLAALTLEHGASLASNDADFARFAGLDWINPLA